MKYAEHISTAVTPQHEPIPGRTDQVKNSAGGYVFEVDPFTQLRRFLILGAEGGTYYLGEKELTKENVESLFKCLDLDAERTVALIEEVSDKGLAYRQLPALFALSLVVSKGVSDGQPDERVIALGWKAFPKVVRTGSHLMTFLSYVKHQRGLGGRGVKRAVTRWLDSRPNAVIASQAFKYAQRDGFSWQDLLSLIRPVTQDTEKAAIYRYLTNSTKWAERKRENRDDVPEIVKPYVSARDASEPIDQISDLIAAGKITWEMVASEKRDKKFWELAFPGMKPIALIRNLANLSRYGVITEGDHQRAKELREKLLDKEEIRKNRVHPLQFLIALATYREGRSRHGEWTPAGYVQEILGDGIDVAFHEIPEIEQSIYLGVDVSGSMWGSRLSGCENVNCAEGAAIMALHFARKAPQSVIRGFCDRMEDLGITARDTHSSVVRRMNNQGFGGTDCALPMLDALGMYTQNTRVKYDAFVVITDNETWAGNIHPTQALQQYRNKVNPNARLVVVAMTGSKFSIADPKDPRQMDMVGFDASAPNILHDFVSGAI